MKKIITSFPETENNVLDALNLHPVLKKVYLHRGIQSPAELERSLKGLLPYHDLLGVETATDVLFDALQNNQRILIVGDYDVDGATATALVVKALRAFGAQHVDFLIPNRFDDGYGLTPEILNLMLDFKPQVIVTVDNGITSNAGINAAHAIGIKVVVTDHHLPGATLPSAEAIVNPNQPGDAFASKHLAGVGVAFYVMLALRAKLRTANWFDAKQIKEPQLAELLDLVALGTISDCVSLDLNNRIMVHQGLMRIRAGKCCPGISALCSVSKRQQERLVSSDLAYALAPRLNAAGRLDYMSLGVSCLLTDSAVEASEIAQQLEKLNIERREIEAKMREEATIAIQNLGFYRQKKLPIGLCLMNEKWHQGIVGVVASKLKDRFNRPVIVFAQEREGILKGSGRSIQSLHLRQVLDKIAVARPDLMLKFGGHAMAAGLSLKQENYPIFENIFNKTVQEVLGSEPLDDRVMTDGSISLGDLSCELVQVLKDGGPWGMDFPEPLFDDRFRVIDQQLIKRKHLKLVLEKDSKTVCAIAFYVDIDEWPCYGCEEIHMVYRVDINEYRGERKVQLIAENIEKISC
ncbi:MAG: single-stranded-DNA-specific exonuclease RecJ [Pseudomonadota bacterium]|nr:single-stranded-DNA-specific exonuclease RecJ [Gammaproteobacteria bacterium]MBU1629221.1 single-stranded-DNA-specific exonuclease RecJ [Gammaproteobacteria bacterium]MBU1926663.1 single-stranded-DNA-specific exonuclease RecJ [Gammaproteobacteria bacterium]MBU2545753.1 single-stranded-DNA-specific exonuclease RecJ [Gammaproteobacteria bacterium]